jgi:hypothetical protein
MRRDPYTHELMEVGSYEFTMEDAEAALLWTQDTYQEYPKYMLYWRAVGMAARFAFSDVTMGLMLPEEIGIDIPFVELVDEPAISAQEVADIVDGHVLDAEEVEATG